MIWYPGVSEYLAGIVANTPTTRRFVADLVDRQCRPASNLPGVIWSCIVLAGHAQHLRADVMIELFDHVSGNFNKLETHAAMRIAPIAEQMSLAREPYLQRVLMAGSSNELMTAGETFLPLPWLFARMASGYGPAERAQVIDIAVTRTLASANDKTGSDEPALAWRSILDHLDGVTPDEALAVTRAASGPLGRFLDRTANENPTWIWGGTLASLWLRQSEPLQPAHLDAALDVLLVIDPVPDQQDKVAAFLERQNKATLDRLAGAKTLKIAEVGLSGDSSKANLAIAVVAFDLEHRIAIDEATRSGLIDLFLKALGKSYSQYVEEAIPAQLAQLVPADAEETNRTVLRVLLSRAPDFQFSDYRIRKYIESFRPFLARVDPAFRRQLANDEFERATTVTRTYDVATHERKRTFGEDTTNLWSNMRSLITALDAEAYAGMRSAIFARQIDLLEKVTTFSDKDAARPQVFLANLLRELDDADSEALGRLRGYIMGRLEQFGWDTAENIAAAAGRIPFTQADRDKLLILALTSSDLRTRVVTQIMALPLTRGDPQVERLVDQVMDRYFDLIVAGEDGTDDEALKTFVDIAAWSSRDVRRALFARVTGDLEKGKRIFRLAPVLQRVARAPGSLPLENFGPVISAIIFELRERAEWRNEEWRKVLDEPLPAIILDTVRNNLPAPAEKKGTP